MLGNLDERWYFVSADVSRDLMQGRRRRLRERCLKILSPIILRPCINFAITPSCTVWKVSVNIPGIKLMRTVWIFREKIDNLSLGAGRPCQGGNGMDFYTNGRRTCRACIVLFLLIRAMVFWRIRTRLRRPCVSSLVGENA